MEWKGASLVEVDEGGGFTGASDGGGVGLGIGAGVGAVIAVGALLGYVCWCWI
jgi:hypothetical protein